MNTMKPASLNPLASFQYLYTICQHQNIINQYQSNRRVPYCRLNPIITIKYPSFHSGDIFSPRAVVSYSFNNAKSIVSTFNTLLMKDRILLLVNDWGHSMRLGN